MNRPTELSLMMLSTLVFAADMAWGDALEEKKSLRRNEMVGDLVACETSVFYVLKW